MPNKGKTDLGKTCPRDKNVPKIPYHLYVKVLDLYSKLVHFETSLKNYNERISIHAYQKPLLFERLLDSEWWEDSICLVFRDLLYVRVSSVRVFWEILSELKSLGYVIDVKK